MLIFFYSTILHISTHPVYNHKSNHYMCSFLHGVKNKTLLQAFSFKLSIQINLYSPSLFKHLFFGGQNIQTNHQQTCNIQNRKFQTTNQIESNYFSHLPLWFFSSLVNVSLADSAYLDYTHLPHLNTLSLCFTATSFLVIFFKLQHSHAQTVDNINIRSL